MFRNARAVLLAAIASTPAAFATPPGGPPVNDNCAGAIVLIPAATCISVTADAAGSTNSLPAITCGGFQGNADDDIWFVFTATQVTHTIQVQGSVGYDAVVEVRTGSCASSSTLLCADNEGVGGTEAIVANGLTVGANYYVRVYDFGTAPSTTTVHICVINGGTPPNDLCSAVVPSSLTPGSALVLSGNTTSATSTGDADAGSVLDGVGPIVWHAFDLSACSNVEVSFCATVPVFQNVVALLATACPANSTMVVADSANTTDCANGNWTVYFNGLAAGTYYLPVVGGVGSTGGYFVFVIADPCPPQNDECTGAILLTAAFPCTSVTGTVVGATGSFPANLCGGSTGVADDDVWYAFVATATSQTINVLGGTGFNAVVELFGGACGALVPLACVDGNGDGGQETLVSSGLTIGQVYHVRVFDHDGTPPLDDTFLICLEGPGFVLTNDGCAQATPLSVHAYADCPASAVYGDNDTATPDGAASCATSAGPDVWYSFNAGTETQLLLRWELLTASWAGVEVLDACGGTPVACAASPDEELIFTTTPGADYVVRVFTDPLQGTTGAFTVCLSTLFVPPDCDGASVRTADFETEISICADGLPDVTGFITTSVATGTYAYVLCDVNDSVLVVLDNDTLDADTLPLGIYHIHGASFTGALVGSTLSGLVSGIASDGTCLDLSDDHVNLNVEICSSVGETGSTTWLVRPNPSDGDLLLSWDRSVHGPLEVRLVDAAGRIAATTTIAATESGFAHLPWKGRVAAGSYHLRIAGADFIQALPVLIR